MLNKGLELRLREVKALLVVADPQVAELIQQVTQLLGRVEKLESHLAQIPTDVEFTFAGAFLSELTDSDESGQQEILFTGSLDEGMMIDAIEHSMRNMPRMRTGRPW